MILLKYKLYYFMIIILFPFEKFFNQLLNYFCDKLNSCQNSFQNYKFFNFSINIK